MRISYVATTASIVLAGFCLIGWSSMFAGEAPDAKNTDAAALPDGSAFLLDLSGGLNGVRGFGPHNQGRVTLVVEDNTPAVKLELVQYMGAEGKREVVNCGIVFGGVEGWEANEGKKAIKFEPSAEYVVEFEAKGTLKRVDICFKSFPESFANGDYWQGQKNVPAVPASFLPNAQWQKYTARFRTRSDTARGGIALQLWCSEKEGGLTLKIGDSLYVRSCTIRKVESAKRKLDLEAE